MRLVNFIVNNKEQLQYYKRYKVKCYLWSFLISSLGKKYILKYTSKHPTKKLKSHLIYSIKNI